MFCPTWGYRLSSEERRRSRRFDEDRRAYGHIRRFIERHTGGRPAEWSDDPDTPNVRRSHSQDYSGPDHGPVRGPVPAGGEAEHVSAPTGDSGKHAQGGRSRSGYGSAIAGASQGAARAAGAARGAVMGKSGAGDGGSPFHQRPPFDGGLKGVSHEARPRQEGRPLHRDNDQVRQAHRLQSNRRVSRGGVGAGGGVVPDMMPDEFEVDSDEGLRLGGRGMTKRTGMIRDDAYGNHAVADRWHRSVLARGENRARDVDDAYDIGDPSQDLGVLSDIDIATATSTSAAAARHLSELPQHMTSRGGEYGDGWRKDMTRGNEEDKDYDQDNDDADTAQPGSPGRHETVSCGRATTRAFYARASEAALRRSERDAEAVAALRRWRQRREKGGK